jgi:hypothetical protein
MRVFVPPDEEPGVGGWPPRRNLQTRKAKVLAPETGMMKKTMLACKSSVIRFSEGVPGYGRTQP